MKVSVDPGDPGLSVTFSPDGNLLATAWSTKVVVWDAATGQEVATLDGDLSGPTIVRLSFSPDGQYLAVANMDGVPKVWDIKNQIEIFSLEGHEVMSDGITYSPDG
jgi:WD40 repeat protein